MENENLPLFCNKCGTELHPNSKKCFCGCTSLTIEPQLQITSGVIEKCSMEEWLEKRQSQWKLPKRVA